MVIPQCLTIEPCARFVCLTSAKTSVLDCWPFCWPVLPLILKAIADDLASKHMAIGCQAWIRLVHSWQHVHSTKIHVFQSSRRWIKFSVGDPDMTLIIWKRKEFEHVWTSTGVDWHFRSVNCHTLIYFAKSHTISFPCLFWFVSLLMFIKYVWHICFFYISCRLWISLQCVHTGYRHPNIHWVMQFITVAVWAKVAAEIKRVWKQCVMTLNMVPLLGIHVKA